MKRIFIIVLAALLTGNQFLIPAFSEPSQNAQKVFKEAVELAINNKVQESIAKYQQAIKLDPRHSNAYNNLGYMYQSIGKLNEAIVHYSKALEINPQDDMACANLASSYLALKDYDKGIQQLLKAMQLDAGSLQREMDLGYAIQKKAAAEGKDPEMVKQEVYELFNQTQGAVTAVPSSTSLEKTNYAVTANASNHVSINTSSIDKLLEENRLLKERLGQLHHLEDQMNELMGTNKQLFQLNDLLNTEIQSLKSTK